MVSREIDVGMSVLGPELEALQKYDDCWSERIFELIKQSPPLQETVQGVAFKVLGTLKETCEEHKLFARPMNPRELMQFCIQNPTLPYMLGLPHISLAAGEAVWLDGYFVWPSIKMIQTEGYAFSSMPQDRFPAIAPVPCELWTNNVQMSPESHTYVPLVFLSDKEVERTKWFSKFKIYNG
jgi:hypothetical protein